MRSRLQTIAASERTAAKMLDMTATDFRRLVDAGSLPRPHRIGGMERWRVADLEAIVSGKAAEDEFET